MVKKINTNRIENNAFFGTSGYITPETLRHKSPFVKYLPQEYNIFKSCNTIKLGTLTHYQSYDGENMIKDLQEGKGTIIDSNGNEFLNYEMIPEGYMFSCSSEFLAQNERSKLDKSYDDFYVIENMEMFIGLIKSRLMESINFDDFRDPDRIKEQFMITDYQNLQIRIISGPVNYVENLKNIKFKINDFRNRTEVIKLVGFTKDRTYEFQKEFRFFFFFYHNNLGYITLKKGSYKIIDIRPHKNPLMISQRHLDISIFKGNKYYPSN